MVIPEQPRPLPVPFCHPRTRLTIGSLDDDTLTVIAHYNPAELTIKKSIKWEAHAERGTPHKPTSSVQDSHEYGGAPTRTISLDLLFDGYETDTSIEPIVQQLETMSAVRDPESHDPEQKRPHFCVVAWGDEMRRFRCVITSLSVRYTMFAHDGTPLRATCTVELTEARLQSRGATRAALTEVARRLAASLRAVVP